MRSAKARPVLRVLLKSRIRFTLLAGLMALSAAQLVRPEVSSVRQDSRHDLLADRNLDPRVRAILKRACADCHSNDAHLPWYGQVSPVSWLLASHIKRGREKLNFSDWPLNSVNERQDIADAADKGGMPLPSYLLIHPEARLTPVDRQILDQWADAR